MDLATLVGVVAGVGLVLASILMNSGLDLFINIPSAMIVIGGTLAATLIAFPINEVIKVIGLFLRVFMVKKSNQYQLIETMVGICNVARKGGVLAIESKLKEVDNDFLKKGLELTVDGKTKPRLILF
jgi:chemotaxis protein MotA